MRSLAVVLVTLGTLGGASSAGAIVGGAGAGPTDSYPFMAALVDHQSASAYDGFFCGGSLVAPMLVLTAAHCVAARTAAPGSIDVVLGRTSLAASVGERIAVTDVIVNPSFDATLLTGDVAVLQLARPAAEVPIALAGSPPAVGVTTMLLGWGNLTGLGGTASYPTTLQRLDAPVLDASACDLYSQFRTAFELCAGDLTALHGACDGDSGGPLVTGDAAASWQLVGTVSYATAPCAQANAPPVFQRADVVVPFLDLQRPPGVRALVADDLRDGRIRLHWSARPGALPADHVIVVVAGRTAITPSVTATSVVLTGLPHDRPVDVALTIGNATYGEAQAGATVVIVGRPQVASPPRVTVRAGVARCTLTWRGILPIHRSTRWLIDGRRGPSTATLRVGGLRGHRVACVVTARNGDGSRAVQSTATRLR